MSRVPAKAIASTRAVFGQVKPVSHAVGLHVPAASVRRQTRTWPAAVWVSTLKSASPTVAAPLPM